MFWITLSFIDEAKSCLGFESARAHFLLIEAGKFRINGGRDLNSLIVSRLINRHRAGNEPSIDGKEKFGNFPHRGSADGKSDSINANHHLNALQLDIENFRECFSPWRWAGRTNNCGGWFSIEIESTAIDAPRYDISFQNETIFFVWRDERRKVERSSIAPSPQLKLNIA